MLCRMTRLRLATSSLLALVLPATTTAADDRALRAEFEKSLRQNLLEVWFPRSLDREHGGFLCDFDYRWQPAGRQPKTIVFQSRCTWVAAQAAARYPDDPRYLEAARHGFRYLNDVMWDKEHGGYYWRLDRQGRPDPQAAGAKHAYGVAFGIYACAAYHRAAKDAQGLALAKQGFEWLERHAHDATHGGYHEFFAREGTVILDTAASPTGGDRDFIGTRVGHKSMNAHIHLLEALTALHEVWPDKKVKRRLEEVHRIVRDRIVVAPPGAMHQIFRPDWTPVPDQDSYGHDVETAYLLLESAHALGEGRELKTTAAAKALIDHALDHAWDAKNGGFFEAGGTFGPVHDKRKVWWVQAEGLNTLLLMSRLYPDDPRGYRKLFERQWGYVKANLTDAENGDWYPDALDAGGNPKANKASEWKACYHVGRTLMNAVDWLGDAPAN
jgi:mannobiose 2-epimerase